MNENRRSVLRASSALTVLSLAIGSGLIKPSSLFASQRAYDEKAFSAKSLDELMRIFGAPMPRENKRVVLIAPDIAENAASVPVEAFSTVPNTEELALLVVHNSSVLAAHWVFPKGTEAKISTRLKIGRSSEVYALVKAEDYFYFAKKEVKVTLGGCGV